MDTTTIRGSNKRRRLDSDENIFACFACPEELHSTGSGGGSTAAGGGGGAAAAAAAAGSTSGGNHTVSPCDDGDEQQHQLVGSRDIQPVIAADGGLWRERFASTCEACYRAALPCVHFRETPLRLLIIGHNPSEHTWSTGFPYSNPSNRFWRLLAQGRVLPPQLPPGCAEAAALGIDGHGNGARTSWGPSVANRLPDTLGIGITDLGCEAGSQADKYPRSTMRRWRDSLFCRLRAHAERAGAAPRVVAFSGVRHWSQLFDPPLKKLGHFGEQPTDQFPPRWPYPSTTPVFVLPSSSGRAVFTKEARQAPWSALGEYLSTLD
jgi:hypothetical protein